MMGVSTVSGQLPKVSCPALQSSNNMLGMQFGNSFPSDGAAVLLHNDNFPMLIPTKLHC